MGGGAVFGIAEFVKCSFTWGSGLALAMASENTAHASTAHRRLDSIWHAAFPFRVPWEVPQPDAAGVPVGHHHRCRFCPQKICPILLLQVLPMGHVQARATAAHCITGVGHLRLGLGWVRGWVAWRGPRNTTFRSPQSRLKSPEEAGPSGLRLCVCAVFCPGAEAQAQKTAHEK